MKHIKTIAISMICFLLLSGCGSTGEISSLSSAAESMAEEHEKLDFAEVVLGDKIVTGYCELSVERALETRTLKNKSEFGAEYFTANKDIEITDDKRFIVLVCSVKNTSNSSIDITQIKCSFTLDDEYEYPGYVGFVQDDAFRVGRWNTFYGINEWLGGDQVTPYSTEKCYLLAQVPNEIADSYKKCRIDFGFNENFDAVKHMREGATDPIDLVEDPWDNIQNRYSITMNV